MAVNLTFYLFTRDFNVSAALNRPIVEHLLLIEFLVCDFRLNMMAPAIDCFWLEM